MFELPIKFRQKKLTLKDHLTLGFGCFFSKHQKKIFNSLIAVSCCQVCIKVIKESYKWSPLSIFAPEGHLDGIPMAWPLVKGLAGLKWWTVQVQTDCALCVADIFHTMQANGVWYVEAHKQ